MVAELLIEQPVLDGHLEGDFLEIAFGDLNRIGVAREHYPVKISASEPKGRPLDCSALIAAVPPHDQVAMLELRH
jgi:hypothetical protein